MEEGRGIVPRCTLYSVPQRWDVPRGTAAFPIPSFPRPGPWRPRPLSGIVRPRPPRGPSAHSKHASPLLIISHQRRAAAAPTRTASCAAPGAEGAEGADSAEGGCRSAEVRCGGAEGAEGADGADRGSCPASAPGRCCSTPSARCAGGAASGQEQIRGRRESPCFSRSVG